MISNGLERLVIDYLDVKKFVFVCSVSLLFNITADMKRLHRRTIWMRVIKTGQVVNRYIGFRGRWIRIWYWLWRIVKFKSRSCENGRSESWWDDWDGRLNCFWVFYKVNKRMACWKLKIKSTIWLRDECARLVMYQGEIVVIVDRCNFRFRVFESIRVVDSQKSVFGSRSSWVRSNRSRNETGDASRTILFKWQR